MAEIKMIPVVDANAMHDPTQVCRTCTYSGNRLWNVTNSDIIKAKNSGTPLSKLGCEPTKSAIHQRVLASREIIDIDDAHPFKSFFTENGEHIPTVGMVDSCGWSPSKKCLGCARFNAITIFVRKPAYPGALTMKPMPVTVGGYCSIPAKGIMVAGRRTTCAPIPKGRDIDPSCLNCRFRFGTYGNTILDDYSRSVVNTDLDPYEMWQARIEGRQSPDNGGIGGAINRWRQEKLSGHRGILSTWPIKITKRYTRMVTKVNPRTGERHEVEQTYAYDFTFRGIAKEHHIAADDPIEDVHLKDGSDLGTLVTLGYGFRNYNLEPGSKYYKLFAPQDFDRVEGVSDYRGEPGTRVFCQDVERKCRMCDHVRNKPCYFHAKNPIFNAADKTYTFANPENVDLTPTVAKIDVRFTRNSEGGYDVTTKNGQTPSASDFFVFFYSHVDRLVLGHHDAKIEALYKTFSSFKSALRRSSVPTIRQSQYGSNTGIEPYKQYCAINNHFPYMGLDFREVMGDRFGMERGSLEYSESLTRRMSEDEYIRVWNPAERLSEEEDTNLNTVLLTPIRPMKEQARKAPEGETITTYLDMFGQVSEHGLSDKERAEYVQWLDNPVDGSVGGTSNREAVYAYTLYRGMRQNQEELFSLREIEKKDDNDRPTEYVCVKCHSVYAIEEINTFDLSCTKSYGKGRKVCGGVLRFYEHQREENVAGTRIGTHNTMPYRRRASTDGAVLADSQSFQEQTRLLRMGCPWWQLNNSSDLWPTTMRTLGYPEKRMQQDWIDDYNGNVDTWRRRLMSTTPVVRLPETCRVCKDKIRRVTYEKLMPAIEDIRKEKLRTLVATLAREHGHTDDYGAFMHCGRHREIVRVLPFVVPKDQR